MNRTAILLVALAGAALGPSACASSKADVPKAGVVGTGGAPGAQPAATPPPCTPPAVDRWKELLIVDDAVVADPERTKPGGVWSFRHLVEAMAPDGVEPADFVETWLKEWSVTTVNTFPVAPKGTGASKMIADWPKTAAGKLDLDKAPFRLLAISNRLDLRDKAKADSAGEGRFVFAALQGGNPASFTVIFEFVLPTSMGKDVPFWASQWHALGALPPGAAYNQALEGVTKLFTERGAGAPKPNGSALGQIRTNEIALGSPWELREFRIDATGQLRLAPTRSCPDQSFNHGNPELLAFIKAHADEVKRGTHVVPDAMLGAAAPETSQGTWEIPGVDEETRHSFALQTCNGCHFGETQSVGTFFHVSPFVSGQAKLSPFLNNPADTTADELSRRASELALVICGVSQDHNPPSAGPTSVPPAAH